MNQNDAKHPELLEMAKEKGMKNYRHLKKSELAKLLKIELSKPTRKEENKSRI